MCILYIDWLIDLFKWRWVYTIVYNYNNISVIILHSQLKSLLTVNTIQILINNSIFTIGNIYIQLYMTIYPLYYMVQLGYVILVYVQHKADVSTFLGSRCEFHHIEYQNDPLHIECLLQV